jgi:hypothetical protein
MLNCNGADRWKNLCSVLNKVISRLLAFLLLDAEQTFRGIRCWLTQRSASWRLGACASDYLPDVS